MRHSGLSLRSPTRWGSTATSFQSSRICFILVQGQGTAERSRKGKIMTMRAFVLAMGLVLAGFAAHARGPDAAGGVNDYPTAVRAEYVFACMASNGQTQEALNRCSCAIDTIAAAVPYDAYEKAETILRMRHEGGGYLAQEFRIPVSNAILLQLQEAQAEADVSCF
jgi:hypothetical protein